MVRVSFVNSSGFESEEAPPHYQVMRHPPPPPPSVGIGDPPTRKVIDDTLALRVPVSLVTVSFTVIVPSTSLTPEWK